MPERNAVAAGECVAVGESAGGRVLGLDPGLRRTGWGILIVGREAQLGACGVIAPDPSASRPARLQTIMASLLEVIDAHEPLAVALERPFVKVNAKSALALAQAQAAAMLAAAQRDLPVFEYAPRQVKQAVTGDGNAAKGAVAEALRLRLDLAAGVAPHDASDALAVAYCHFLLGGGAWARTPAP